MSEYPAMRLVTYSRIEKSARNPVVCPYGDHQTEAKSQTNEQQTFSAGCCRTVLRCSLRGSKSEPEEHGCADELAEHGDQVAS